MSTRNDKCHGCGEAEMHASSGVIVYVCGTTLSQFGTSRSITCHGIEAAILRRRICELVEHVARLEEAGDEMAKDFSHFWTDRKSVRDWPKAKEAKP